MVKIDHMPSRWTPFLKSISTLVRLLPVAKDTVRGRKSSQSTKVVLLVLGLFFLLGGRSSMFLGLVGLIIMLSAIIVPIAELQRRTWLFALKNARTTTHTRHVGALLVHDGRRLELWREGKMLRRVLTNHPFELKKHDEHSDAQSVLWSVHPHDSGKKRDAIWFSVAKEKELVSGLGVFEDAVHALSRETGVSDVAYLKEPEQARGLMERLVEVCV